LKRKSNSAVILSEVVFSLVFGCSRFTLSERKTQFLRESPLSSSVTTAPTIICDHLSLPVVHNSQLNLCCGRATSDKNMYSTSLLAQALQARATGFSSGFSQDLILELLKHEMHHNTSLKCEVVGDIESKLQNIRRQRCQLQQLLASSVRNMLPPAPLWNVGATDPSTVKSESECSSHLPPPNMCPPLHDSGRENLREHLSKGFVPGNTGNTSQAYLTGRWSMEEEKRFQQALDLHGCDWRKVCKVVRTRSLRQIRTHAHNHKYQAVVKNPRGQMGKAPPQQLNCPRLDLLAVEATKLEEMPACNKSTQIFNRMCSKTAPTTSSTFQILSNACSHHSPAQAARDTSNIRLNFSKRRGVPDDKLGKPIP
jgi:hypothetical protein